MIQHKCFISFCTDQTTGSRGTSNKYCQVFLTFSKTKTIKGNPSSLGLEAIKICTQVCCWGNKTIRTQILLCYLKKFFLFMGHSYSTRLWLHSHNCAVLHLFKIAMIMAGKKQAVFQVSSVCHIDFFGISSIWKGCEIPPHLLGMRWAWNHKKCCPTFHCAMSDICVLKNWEREDTEEDMINYFKVHTEL